MRKWPLATNELILVLLQKILLHSENDNDIRQSARSSIDNVLNLLELRDYEYVIAVMPTLLDNNNTPSVSRQLFPTSTSGPSKPKKVKPSPAAKPTVDKKPSLKSLGIFIKRTVRQGIIIIRGRDAAAGETERWKTLWYSEIFDEVHKLEPLIPKSSVANTIKEARSHVRVDEKKKKGKGEVVFLITGTEWIVLNTQEESPKAERHRATYLKRQALGLCHCTRPVEDGYTKCPTCREKDGVRTLQRGADSKPAWTDCYKHQLFHSTYGRMEPIEHRNADITHYIYEAEKLATLAMKQIETVEFSCYKVGAGDAEDRESGYTTHHSDLTNSLSWPSDDVNVVTIAEIILAFKMNEVYGEGANCVDRLGWHVGRKFTDDGDTIASDLYLRHN